MTDHEFILQVKELFRTYQEDFGLSDEYSIVNQEIFSSTMAKLICNHDGEHDFVGDMCGHKEHDICVKCGIRRGEMQ